MFAVQVIGARMNKNNNCCLYALLAVVVAVLTIVMLRGYGFADLNLFSWLGAVVIIVAVLVCVRCKQSDDQDD